MLITRQRGASLVELMIAIVIAMVISVALGAVFVNATKAKQEVQRTNEQTENAKLAMDFLLQDIRMAGFWDGLEYTSFPDPALPNICESASLTALRDAVPVYLQGNDDESFVTLTCLPDRKTGTDAVIVRRAATCEQGEPGCEAVAPYFQASSCRPPYSKQDGSLIGSVGLGQELASSTVTDWFGVQSTVAALTLHTRTCGPNAGGLPYAPVRRYLARVYYVANNDVAGDGLPTLKVAEIRGSTWMVTTVATGIEQLQVEYRVDTAPDSYVSAGAGDLDSAAEWRQISAVRVHLLARNSTSTPQYQSSKTYVMGRKLDGSDKVFGPFTDSIRRHAYTGQVSVTNPVGLRGG